MLNKEEVSKIRELLENSENPLFLFDDDQDGLCAFAVLMRRYGKGNSVAIKVNPELDKSYISVVNEYNPDLIVVLDKPLISKEFVSEVRVPILWMDHHPVVDVKKLGGQIYYFNPLVHNKDIYLPTTYLAYQVTEEKSWFVLAGCIADYFMPEFYDYYLELYPDLLIETSDPGEVTYGTRFGDLIKSILFLLKGKTSDVKKNVKLLLKIESPYDILNQETEEGKSIVKFVEKSAKEFKSLLNDAIKEVSGDKFLIFVYPGSKNSYTTELSNELIYKFKDKFVIVGREKSGAVKISMRVKKGINLPRVLERALVGIDGYGGGHKNACGGSVKQEDFERFVMNLRDEVGK